MGSSFARLPLDRERRAGGDVRVSAQVPSTPPEQVEQRVSEDGSTIWADYVLDDRGVNTAHHRTHALVDNLPLPILR
jgi:hypothetical protein